MHPAPRHDRQPRPLSRTRSPPGRCSRSRCRSHRATESAARTRTQPTLLEPPYCSRIPPTRTPLLRPRQCSAWQQSFVWSHWVRRERAASVPVLRRAGQYTRHETSLTITLLMSSPPAWRLGYARTSQEQPFRRTRPERHLPQPGALAPVRPSADPLRRAQGAHFWLIARHALTEDLVATKRTRKLEPA